jgi:hypothetical protein
MALKLAKYYFHSKESAIDMITSFTNISQKWELLIVNHCFNIDDFFPGSY